MKEDLKIQFELFVKNTQAIKKDFFLDYESMKTMSALFYTIQNKTMDCDAIKQCHKLIKENAGIFSVIRGNLCVVIASRLSLTDNPQKQLANTISVYEQMKKAKFKASDYLIYAAYIIVEQAQESNYNNVIERAKSIYDGMKKKHWFITGEEDYIYATSIALSNEPIETTLSNMEDIFTELKPSFFSSNAVQGLAQTLALNPNDKQAIERVMELKKAFRDVNLKLDNSETLSSLGILAMIPIELNELVNSITDGYHFLRKEKGFGMWSLEKSEVLLFTIAIVTSYYLTSNNEPISMISTNLINILITQQIMMMMLYLIFISTSTSAAVSNNN